MRAPGEVPTAKSREKSTRARYLGAAMAINGPVPLGTFAASRLGSPGLRNIKTCASESVADFWNCVPEILTDLWKWKPTEKELSDCRRNRYDSAKQVGLR